MNTALVLPAARAPRPFSAQRLLHVDRSAGKLFDRTLDALPAKLLPGDLLIVNDSATLPAALELTSHAAELRLAGRTSDRRFVAVLFGAGDFSMPTEARVSAPRLTVGDRVEAGVLGATIAEVDREEPRLVTLEFDLGGAELLAALYRVGKVIQYSYVERPLELWDVQSRFAGRPWSFEPASAGLPLTFALFDAVRARGVELASLSHAAGISSTGSATLDRRLPFSERYEIPESTARALERTRARGGRVIAVGTSVVRALESSALEHGLPVAGSGEARLLLGPGYRLRVVTGILTGLHDPSTSHYSLLEAFAPRSLLDGATEHLLGGGYLQHEFGDSCLIL